MPSSQPVAGEQAIKDEYTSPEKKQSSMARPSEPNRSSSYSPKKPHVTETPITKANFYKHVNWLNVSLIVGVPIYGLVQAYWVPLKWQTAMFAVVYYFMTGFGITAGEICNRTGNFSVID